MSGIHPSAVIETGASIDPTATVGPFCCVGAEVRLAAGVELKSRHGAWQMDIGYPAYQNLNGPQSKNNLKFSLQYSLSI